MKYPNALLPVPELNPEIQKKAATLPITVRDPEAQEIHERAAKYRARNPDPPC